MFHTNLDMLILTSSIGWVKEVLKKVGIEKLYELREVAETTGLTLGTVRQYVSAGVIPALYLGRKRVIKASVLEKICTEGLKTKKEDTEAVSA